MWGEGGIKEEGKIKGMRGRITLHGNRNSSGPHQEESKKEGKKIMLGGRGGRGKN